MPPSILTAQGCLLVAMQQRHRLRCDLNNSTKRAHGQASQDQSRPGFIQENGRTRYNLLYRRNTTFDNTGGTCLPPWARPLTTRQIEGTASPSPFGHMSDIILDQQVPELTQEHFGQS